MQIWMAWALAFFLCIATPAQAMSASKALANPLATKLDTSYYPINNTDPDGLLPEAFAKKIFDLGTHRAEKGMNYWGGMGETDRGNCVCDTMNGQGVDAENVRYDRGKALELMDKWEKPDAPKIGDVVVFGEHFGTVVDFTKDKKAVVYGRDGDYGKWSGTLDQWLDVANYHFMNYYRNPESSAGDNRRVQEYRDRQKATRASSGGNGIVYPKVQAEMPHHWVVP